MKLDPKGIEAAGAAVEHSRLYGDSHEGAETAITAYLKATGSVIVPREPTNEMAVIGREALEKIGVFEPYATDATFCYRAMIQAAEGK